jgi:hypothetical protein
MLDHASRTFLPPPRIQTFGCRELAADIDRIFVEDAMGSPLRKVRPQIPEQRDVNFDGPAWFAINQSIADLSRYERGGRQVA